MNIRDRFLDYADAFEITYKDNDWTRLEPYFTEGDTVSTHWTARYSKAGVPDLQFGESL